MPPHLQLGCCIVLAFLQPFSLNTPRQIEQQVLMRSLPVYVMTTSFTRKGTSFTAFSIFSFCVILAIFVNILEIWQSHICILEASDASKRSGDWENIVEFWRTCSSWGDATSVSDPPMLSLCKAIRDSKLSWIFWYAGARGFGGCCSMSAELTTDAFMMERCGCYLNRRDIGCIGAGAFVLARCWSISVVLIVSIWCWLHRRRCFYIRRGEKRVVVWSQSEPERISSRGSENLNNKGTTEWKQWIEHCYSSEVSHCGVPFSPSLGATLHILISYLLVWSYSTMK